MSIQICLTFLAVAFAGCRTSSSADTEIKATTNATSANFRKPKMDDVVISCVGRDQPRDIIAFIANKVKTPVLGREDSRLMIYDTPWIGFEKKVFYRKDDDDSNFPQIQIDFEDKPGIFSGSIPIKFNLREGTAKKRMNDVNQHDGYLEVFYNQCTGFESLQAFENNRSDWLRSTNFYK